MHALQMKIRILTYKSHVIKFPFVKCLAKVNTQIQTPGQCVDAARGGNKEKIQLCMRFFFSDEMLKN